MVRNKISAAIITFNEEENIGRCLVSLQGVADEIVVVDSFSTDKTEEICKQYGVKFIQHPFHGHIEQKNVAIAQTSYDYVLSLDADEALDQALADNIKQEKINLSADAYIFKRKSNYCGKWINHCGWYPDKKLRLWNKTKGTWGGDNPHDKVIMRGQCTSKELNGVILHYTVKSIESHVHQFNKFSSIAAQEAFGKGKKTSFIKVLLSPIFKFIRDYIFKLGFLDGYYGFVICANSSFAKYLKYLKLYELNRQSKSGIMEGE